MNIIDTKDSHDRRDELRAKQEELKDKYDAPANIPPEYIEQAGEIVKRIQTDKKERSELRQEIDKVADSSDLEIILLEPEELDEAIIGMTDDNNVVYSYDKLVDVHVNHHGMSAEEAVEWVDYNIVRGIGYMGGGDERRPPVIVHKLWCMQDEG